jgi:hypothetical protein
MGRDFIERISEAHPPVDFAFDTDADDHDSSVCGIASLGVGQ